MNVYLNQFAKLAVGRLINLFIDYAWKKVLKLISLIIRKNGCGNSGREKKHI